MDFNIFRNASVANHLSSWSESSLTVSQTALRTQLRLVRDHYRKVESAYQCWQSGVDSQTTFTAHLAFRTFRNIDRPTSLYDSVKMEPLIPADLFSHHCGFWMISSPKKENTKKTCGLSYGALQNPSFKEKVE